MNNIFTFFFIFYSSAILSQTRKESVYLLFDTRDKERCKILFEEYSNNSTDGVIDGYQTVNKYRKWHGENHIDFMICDEKFRIYDTKKSDTSSVKILERINCVNTKYLNDEKSKTILRQHPFEKIFILEKISADKVVKHEVIWVDEWVEIY